MSRNRFLFILTFIIAAALRFVFLGWKPPHFDESINGWFVSQVWEKGYYNYDPTNFHGPLFFYYLQFFEILFGKSVEAMRVATGILSLVIIYLTLLHRRFVGNLANWAALFIAISPAYVFYSRYAIHETLFILAQVLFSLGFWNWRTQKTWISYAQMASAVVILASTKETFFIFLGTWAIAIASLKIIEKVLKQPHEKASQLPLSQTEKWRILQVTLASIVVMVAMFSNLFSDFSALKEFFSSLAVWSKTGSGKSGHEKPFYYWLQLMLRYEWPVLFALALTPLAILRRGTTALRIIALVGFGTWLAYSIIPYKTPWLVMGMVWPLAFVIGWSIEVVRIRIPHKILIAALALFLVSPLIQTYKLNFVRYTDASEPYVYVQSTKDVRVAMNLVYAQIERWAADYNMKIEVMTEEGWPFPYIFGGYPNLHYMKLNSFDREKLNSADVIFYDGKDSVAIEGMLADEYYRLPLHLRSAYQPGFALFKVSKFKGLLPEQTLTKGRAP